MAETKKAATQKYQVNIQSVNIRKSMDDKAKPLKVVYRGQTFTGMDMGNGWLKAKEYNGYVKSKFCKVFDEVAYQSLQNVVNYNKVQSDIAKMQSSFDSNALDKMLTNDMIGIFGAPYQFMSHVDRRLTSSSGKTSIGRKYGEKIVGRMPLLFLTPCEQVFMPSYKGDDKKAVLASLGDLVGGKTLKGSVEDIISQQGRYYETKYAYAEYFKYVNTMCTTTASLLGIANEKITIGSNKNVKVGRIQWQKALNPSFKKFFDASSNIVFYIDSPNSISESFTNSTRESSLVSSVNGLSDTAKELNFILNNGLGTQIEAMQSENYESTLSSINKVIDSYLGGNGVLKSLAGNFSTVLSGGKLIFPEIWSDSDFSRSYDVDIKLRSPDGDRLSIFLNILVPYIHLLCLTCPREQTANGFRAPFLVKAFYKGMFNVDMGIIQSLSVNRGDESSWTDDGLPTKLNISLSIKDLYTSMYISKDTKPTKVVQNAAMMDYLSNLCGVNMTKSILERKIEVAWLLGTNKIVNLPGRLWSSFDTAIANKLSAIDKLYGW